MEEGWKKEEVKKEEGKKKERKKLYTKLIIFGIFLFFLIILKLVVSSQSNSESNYDATDYDAIGYKIQEEQSQLSNGINESVGIESMEDVIKEWLPIFYISMGIIIVLNLIIPLFRRGRYI